MEQGSHALSLSPSGNGRLHRNGSIGKVIDDNPAWPTLPTSVVKSAGRVLQILEFFDDTRRAANMVDVSRALGYPESSTSILLRSLVTLGYLDYDRCKRTYRPTNRVRLLGSWIEPRLFQGDAIIRFMEDLNSETSDVVILASRNGMNAQYIHVVQARTALRLHLMPGTMRPIATSAVGYVLLSRMTDIEIVKLIRRVNAEAPTLADLVKIADIHDLVGGIRRDGYVAMDSKVTPGTSIIAMPLPTNVTTSPLVIAIGGPSERINSRRQELIELVSQRVRERFSS